jgi:peptidyl-prolyl cis-trans isomerase C
MLQWTGYVQAEVKEEELKRYYEANKEFFDQVTVRASHILKQLTPNASEADKKAARDKLLQLRTDILAGKIEFADAARKESECQVSAAAGGDIGYFPRKFLFADSFAEPAFALKVGDISDVIETPLGLHIIKVTDRKAGRATEYINVQDEVREFYVEEMRMKLMAQEREKAKIEFK